MSRPITPPAQPVLKPQISTSTTSSDNPPVSPALQHYQLVASQFRQYVEDLSPKIDTICDKENYRTHLKQQHLNSIRRQLDAKKHKLEAILEEKRNPKSSQNGKLVQELEQLHKMETTYKKMVGTSEEQVTEARREIKELEEEIKQRKIVSKYSIQSAFNNNESVGKRLATEGEFEVKKENKKRLKHRDSRNSLISRVRNGLTSKAEKQLELEESKTLALRFLKGYLLKQKTENRNAPYTEHILPIVERDLRKKEALLREAREILKRQCEQISG